MKKEKIEKKILGPLLTLKKGKKPKSQSPTKEKGMQPYVDIKAFETGVIDNYTDDDKCVPCNEGDLLIVCDGSRSGYVGRAIKGYTGSTLAKISAEGVDNSYLYYFIQSMYRLLNTQIKGTGTPHLNVEVLRKAELVIPSIPEQKRIVDKIEELFSELDSAVETLKKTKEQLAVYRQSVLKEAFSLKANKNDLGDYIKNIESGKSFKCVETPPQKKEFGIIKVSSVTWGKFNENESKTCKPEQFLESKRVCKGDFLFGRANTLQLIGACVIVDDIEKNLMLSDKILRIHFLSTIKKEYVLFFLKSIMGKKQIQGLSTGNQESMRNIGQDRIRKIQIPVPSLKEQEKIVQDIKFKLSACENIEKTVNEALMQADAMRQSILKKAFEGEL